jgi:hypothetical protein
MSKVKEEIENMIRDKIDYVWNTEDKKVEAIITSLGAAAILSLFVHELIENVGISKEDVPSHVLSAICVTSAQMIEVEKALIKNEIETQNMSLFSFLTKKSKLKTMNPNAL